MRLIGGSRPHGVLAVCIAGLIGLGSAAKAEARALEDIQRRGVLSLCAAPNALPRQVFFFLYFAMTGLHAVHLTIGVVIVLVVLYRAYMRDYSPEYYTPVENAGLYWHFVDIIWLFLYPLFYLIDLHS